MLEKCFFFSQTNNLFVDSPQLNSTIAVRQDYGTSPKVFKWNTTLFERAHLYWQVLLLLKVNTNVANATVHTRLTESKTSASIYNLLSIRNSADVLK